MAEEVAVALIEVVVGSPEGVGALTEGPVASTEVVAVMMVEEEVTNKVAAEEAFLTMAMVRIGEVMHTISLSLPPSLSLSMHITHQHSSSSNSVRVDVWWYN